MKVRFLRRNMGVSCAHLWCALPFSIPHSPFRIRRRRNLWLRLRRPRPSFTLVELLAALALTALVVAITGRIALQGVNTRKAVTDLISRLEGEAVVFESLREDFATLLTGLPGDQTPVRVFGAPRQVLQLSTLAAITQGNATLHLVRRPATVRYRLAGEGSEKGLDLVREVIDRTDAGARPVSETIGRHLASFALEVLAKNKWTTGQPAKDDRPEDVQAVRVTLGLSGGDPVTRTFVVSSGY